MSFRSASCDGRDTSSCSKNVVYCMSSALCGELHVGETGRPVRERFQEHFRDARTRAVKTPWGHHYKTEHQGNGNIHQHLSAVPSGEDCWKGVFTSFAQILGSD